jgi:4'-phosphopantetheinyl transferase
MALESLPINEAHVWYVRSEHLTEPNLLRSYDEVQTAEERDRGGRFLVERARHEHRVCRALVRSVLSHYAPVPPAMWSFATNEHGKPHISGPDNSLDLRFNLSHSAGMVVCLIARETDVGIDCEPLDRVVDFEGLSARFFAPAEAAEIARLPNGPARCEGFFRFWTLKEAYIKARGLGLSIPLSTFAFDLGQSQPAISFAAPLEDDARQWQFTSTVLGQHVLATAIRNVAALELRIRETIPLASEQSE